MHLELFGAAELVRKNRIGVGDALFLRFDEGLAEREEEPVSICDQDVMEQFAEFRIACGSRALFHREKEIAVCPPFVANQLVDQGKHGRNVAEILCFRMEVGPIGLAKARTFQCV